MATDENGNTDLMQAVIARNITEITRLCNILTEEEKEVVNNEGYTALMLATMYGMYVHLDGIDSDLDEMQALINGGVDLETTDARGYTALHIAAEYDRPIAISLLLSNGANIRAKNMFGYTPQMVAAGLNHSSAINAINLAAITRAIVLHHLGISTSINLETEKDFMEIADGRGYTAIMLAAEHNHGAAIIELRANGANLEAADSDNYTAVMIAAKENNLEAIEALTEDMSTEEVENLGADLEARDNNGCTAVIIAAEKNNIVALTKLLDKGAKINARTINIEGGLTALIIALQKNKTEAAELLIRYGASIKAGYDGLTPFMCAVANGNIRIMKLLKAKNVNLNDGSRDGKTAISFAIENKQMEAIEWLAANGAEVSYVYEIEELDKIIVANQPMFHLLNTAEIIDKIFTKEEIIEEDGDFINSNEFNWRVAAQRFIFLCVENAEGTRLNQQIASANRLFQDNFESWFDLMEGRANLSETINQLIADGLSLRHQQIISNLFRISESSYKDAVGESYINVDHPIILPIAENNIVDIETLRKRKRCIEEDESELSAEIDEDDISSGEEDDEESSGEEGKNDADNIVASGHTNVSGNTQEVQQRAASLDVATDEKKEVINSNIVENKVEDDTEFNTRLETIFAGWTEMPQQLQNNLLHAHFVQAMLQFIVEREAMYSPKSIAAKFAEIFIVEKRDNSAESTQDSSDKKAACAEVTSGLVDTNFIYNAFKVGICILPMVARSGMLGEFLVLEQFGVEVA